MNGQTEEKSVQTITQCILPPLFQVQERQNRVCTTVAIAIVAETCSPFTVLPGLMNEYRVPELNVQVYSIYIDINLFQYTQFTL